MRAANHSERIARHKRMRRVRGPHKIPGGPDSSRDIVEQLNCVASQLPSACRKQAWGAVHADVLLEAVREIRRLRAVIYTPEVGIPLSPRPPENTIGTPTAFDRTAYFGMKA